MLIQSQAAPRLHLLPCFRRHPAGQTILSFSFVSVKRTVCSLGPGSDAGGSPSEIRFSQSVDDASAKARLDAWLSARIEGVSRARIQASIRRGLVSVNGNPVNKVSHVVKMGDWVDCTVSELEPLRAKPEDIPIDVVYEDAHLIVVNKPPHMVVHPAPGHPNGTLVNGILHHCGFADVRIPIAENSSDTEDAMYTDEFDDLLADPKCIVYDNSSTSSSVRPGIVHRLDKGTSGLLVVAKDAHSHGHLAEQFKMHTIKRVYISITSGVPAPSDGRIEMPIARDMNNRIRMAAVATLNRGARYAASR